MNCNNLKCRCGAADDWQLSWTFTDTWNLLLTCDQCGAVYTLAQNDDYNARVIDVLKP